MDNVKIPKRITTALLNSLTAGVTPRIGLEYMAVGRKAEIGTLLDDLTNISQGGSVFRIIAGRYGSGKSFLLQIIRNYAMERNYAVTDVDLSPERKLSGNKGNGLATYRELMHNLSTRVRPDGGALPSMLERWISGIRASVMKEEGGISDGPVFESKTEIKIIETVNSMDSMVHGYDFAKVVTAYWHGLRSGSDDLKNAALKWLCGEYSTKTEAHAELGVRIIIDDDTWFDYIKLMTSFVRQIGYAGFLMLLDEGVNLYKISNTVARNNNYEKILNMFNDTMQGKVSSLGIYLCGTPQFIEDARRGLFSYEALRTRLASSRFLKDGIRDMQSPLIYLERLTNEEIFVLLQKILNIHEQHFEYKSELTGNDLVAFMQLASDRLGAEQLLTPREIIRDFAGLLNVTRQNPRLQFRELLGDDLFKVASADPDDGYSNDRETGAQKTPEGGAAEFEL